MRDIAQIAVFLSYFHAADIAFLGMCVFITRFNIPLMAALIVTDGALAGAVEIVVSGSDVLIADPADGVMTIPFIRFVIPVAMLLDYCLMADPAFLFMLGRAVPTVFPIMIALHMADRAVTIGTVNMLALGIADRAVAVGIKIMFALIVTVSAIPDHVKVGQFSAKLKITQ